MALPQVVSESRRIKAYVMTALVIDTEGDYRDADDAAETISDARLPNHAASPTFFQREEIELDWTDGHPLNTRGADVAAWLRAECGYAPLGEAEPALRLKLAEAIARLSECEVSLRGMRDACMEALGSIRVARSCIAEASVPTLDDMAVLGAARRAVGAAEVLLTRVKCMEAES